MVEEDKKERMIESSYLISQLEEVEEENLDDIPLWNRYYKLR